MISSSDLETAGAAQLADLRARMEKLGVAPAADTPGRRAFMDGAVCKALGFLPGDLSVGFEVANRLAKRGELENALPCFVTLAICEPRNAAYLRGLAACWLHLGCFDLALRSAAAVISLEPGNPAGYWLSARANLSLHRRADALSDLRAALERAEKSGDRRLAAEIGALLGKAAAVATAKEAAPAEDGPR